MLANMQDYFKEQYQFSLKNAVYNRLEVSSDNSTLMISDEISATIDKDVLNVTYTRTLHFDPEAAFYLTVTFDIVLSFKEELIDAAREIDWAKEFIETANPYLSNILTRTSALIASITSSYGQQPIITPPGIVKTEN